MTPPPAPAVRPAEGDAKPPATDGQEASPSTDGKEAPGLAGEPSSASSKAPPNPLAVFDKPALPQNAGGLTSIANPRREPLKPHPDTPVHELFRKDSVAGKWLALDRQRTQERLGGERGNVDDQIDKVQRDVDGIKKQNHELLRMVEQLYFSSFATSDSQAAPSGDGPR